MNKTRTLVWLAFLAGVSLCLAGAALQSQDKGLGPIKELTLGPVNKALAEKGKAIFEEKCAMCHGLLEDKTGPALADVLSRVRPEFVVNFLLNTAEMEQKDGRIISLIRKYGVAMPPPGIDTDKAMAILEYLRTTQKAKQP